MHKLSPALSVCVLLIISCSVNAGGLYGEVTSLTEPSPALLDAFGHGYISGIALSSDGQTAVVAAAAALVSGVRAGKVYIYHFANGNWTLSQEIDDPVPAALDEFGWAVAISGDGKSVLIGSIEPVNGQYYAGKAYLYALNNGSWSQEYEFDDPAATGLDSFSSSSVALSGDGDTAVIGAYGTNASAGEAYVFQKMNGSWSLAASIPDPDATSTDEFGSSVAITTDGNSILVGSNAAVGGNNYAGKVYLFTLNNGAWVQEHEFDDPAATKSDFFGLGNVALSGDGQTAVIGAHGANSSDGEAYIFSKSNGTWMQVKAIADPDESTGFNDYFGSTVAVSENGTTALIGSQAAVGINSFAGKAYLYTLDNGQWTQTKEFDDPAASAGAGFGYTGVALAADGEALFISAGATILNNIVDAGEVYLYQSPDDLSIALSPSPATVTAGQQLELNLSVNNTDAQITAFNATLIDTLPSGLSYVSSNGAGGDCTASGATITCTIASLAPQGVWQPTITVATTGAGTLNDTASITSNEPDPNTANNNATASIMATASSGHGNGSGGGGGTLDIFALGFLCGLLVLAGRRDLHQVDRHDQLLPAETV
ncbi:MAG: hypothetical protein WBR29_11335 [Gammaproteobacteria bacterium]